MSNFALLALVVASVFASSSPASSSHSNSQFTAPTQPFVTTRVPAEETETAQIRRRRLPVVAFLQIDQTRDGDVNDDKARYRARSPVNIDAGTSGTRSGDVRRVLQVRIKTAPPAPRPLPGTAPVN